MIQKQLETDMAMMAIASILSWWMMWGSFILSKELFINCMTATES
jgi:hypothetical protein